MTPRLRWMWLLWPLVVAWPLWVVWRGPTPAHEHFAPYHFGPWRYERRTSPRVRRLVGALEGETLVKPPRGMTHCFSGGQLKPACRAALFAYLLSWQGDPRPLRSMTHVFPKDANARLSLKRACGQWSSPSSLGHAADEADQMWGGFCRGMK